MTKMRTSAAAAVSTGLDQSGWDHSDFVDTCSSLMAATGLDPRWQRMKVACDHPDLADEYDYMWKQILNKHTQCSVRYLQCMVVMPCPL
jgi:hypothetical protein